MKRVGPIALVAIIAVFSRIGTAGAPTAEDVRAAAEAFDRGREAFKQENFVEAADNFESADARAPSASALKLAIRARDLAEQLDRAATLAALGMRRHADDADLVEIAETVLSRARHKLHEVRISCDESCEVLLDGKIVPGGAVLVRTIYVLPEANYNVRVTWSGGRSSSRELTSEEGGSSVLDFVAPVPEPSRPPSEPVNDSVTRDEPVVTRDLALVEQGEAVAGTGMSSAVFWLGVGLTGVAGGITAWSGIDTKNNPGVDKVRNACRSASPDCERLYEEGLDRQNRTNLLLAITGGLALTTIVVGAVATDWGGAPEPEIGARLPRHSARSVNVEPWVSLNVAATEAPWWSPEAQVGAVGRF